MKESIDIIGMTRNDLRKYQTAVEAMREQGITIQMIQYRAAKILEM